MLCHFCHVRLFATLWSVAHQAPLSMGFSGKDYWSGLPRPPPGDLPDPGIKPVSLTYPALAGRFFTTRATWEAPHLSKDCGLSRCKTSHCPRSSPSQSSEEGLLDSSPLQRTVSLNPPNSSKTRLSANSLRRNGGSEKLIHLPKVTCLVNVKFRLHGTDSESESEVAQSCPALPQAIPSLTVSQKCRGRDCGHFVHCACMLSCFSCV